MSHPWSFPVDPSPRRLSQEQEAMVRIAGYNPSPSLVPFEAFRLGVSEGRAAVAQQASRALIAEGRDIAHRVMAGAALPPTRPGVSSPALPAA